MIAVIDSGYRPIKLPVAPSRILSPKLNLVPGATEPSAISAYAISGFHPSLLLGTLEALHLATASIWRDRIGSLIQQ